MPFLSIFIFYITVGKSLIKITFCSVFLVAYNTNHSELFRTNKLLLQVSADTVAKDQTRQFSVLLAQVVFDELIISSPSYCTLWIIRTVIYSSKIQFHCHHCGFSAVCIALLACTRPETASNTESNGVFCLSISIPMRKNLIRQS